MAELALNGSIPLRECLVKGKPHYFHQWMERRWAVDASSAVGGHPAGFCAMTMALVEDENGQIHEVYPNEIRFTDRELETTENTEKVIPCNLYKGGVCLGAKGCPTCFCHGDKNKCTFYSVADVGDME